MFDDLDHNVFLEFANNLGRGYLKLWKASGILMTLRDFPEIASDPQRLRSYLDNCLRMEGFLDPQIEACAIFFEQWVDYKTTFGKVS